MDVINKIKRTICFTGIVFLIIGWRYPENRFISTYNQQADTTKAFNRNKNIGSGINFGKSLEAPNEGDVN